MRTKRRINAATTEKNGTSIVETSRRNKAAKEMLEVIVIVRDRKTTKGESDHKKEVKEHMTNKRS